MCHQAGNAWERICQSKNMIIYAELKQGKTYWLFCMRICDVFCCFGPLASLKNVNSTRGGVLLLITENNPPHQVLLRLLMRLMASNCEKHHVLCLLSSSKRTLYSKSVVFLYNSISPSRDTTNNSCDNPQTQKLSRI